MDHHTVAAVSISGSCLDVLGSLYLAYDLLGGKHGPLRLLTRAVTYSIVFGVGYGLGLGALFGLFAGMATGVTVAIELNRVSRGMKDYSLGMQAFFSTIRSVGIGLGLYPAVGLRFVMVFGALLTVGQVLGYAQGVKPSMDYVASRRPRFTRRQFWGTVVRTFGYASAALVCNFLVRHVDHPWTFALRIGVVVGIVTAAGVAVNPFIEYYADNLPERRLGVFGIGLILVGFALQSMQYWLALFDVRLT